MAEPLKQTDDLYRTDFYAWTQDQAAKLRAQRSAGGNSEIDWQNILEEIETLGRAEKRETRHLLGTLLLSLMKWGGLTGFRSGSMQCGIKVERMELDLQLRENRSLRPLLPDLMADEYICCRWRFVAETGLAEDTNPLACPFTIEQILDPDFYPEGDA